MNAGSIVTLLDHWARFLPSQDEDTNAREVKALASELAAAPILLDDDPRIVAAATLLCAIATNETAYRVSGRIRRFDQLQRQTQTMMRWNGKR